MTTPRRPAAYIRIAGTDSWACHAMRQAASQRGWPAPVIYAEDQAMADGSYGQAMGRLEAAIAAGRHDALLLAAPANPGQLMRLLALCTKTGVAVSFLAGPAASAQGTTAAEAGSVTSPDLAAEAWDVLARARLEALGGIFPGWRIWLDRHGWHARRRDNFLQRRGPGAPAFHVNAGTALDLAAQLYWQQTAETAAPAGSQASILSPPPQNCPVGAAPQQVTA
jgi:hypothetical protein